MALLILPLMLEKLKLLAINPSNLQCLLHQPHNCFICCIRPHVNQDAGVVSQASWRPHSNNDKKKEGKKKSFLTPTTNSLHSHPEIAPGCRIRFFPLRQGEAVSKATNWLGSEWKQSLWSQQETSLAVSFASSSWHGETLSKATEWLGWLVSGKDVL